MSDGSDRGDMHGQRDVPRVIWSWALFDWANSAFTTLVVTFIYSTYFSKAMAPDEATGTLWWSRAVSISALITSLLSPVVGAAADRAGARKWFLAVTVVLCVVGTTVLAFVSPAMPNAALIALTAYVIADFNFETGYVFYNAFLPTIASPDRIGRVSGYGWGLGYAGGLLCMGIALVGFVQPEVPWFHMAKTEGFNIRATNLLVAIWFAVFSLPLFLFVPERRVGAVRFDAKAAFRELAGTFREIRKYREVGKYLLARLIYNDGLVTIFAFGGIYAQGTFGMSLAEVIVFGVVLNLASGIGSFALGPLDDKIGGKTTIMVTLVALIVATVMAVAAPNRAWFWAAGILIGLFVGPNQSASRSLMSRMVPERNQSEFFGFFNFSGKATSFLGPFLLGVMTAAFGSQRAGVAVLILFFIIGGILLTMVNERDAIALARSEDAAGRT
ncbi:MAG: MFS transporter [Gemmatimonadaceae bacterium]